MVHRMLAYAVLLVLAVAGYAGASAWTVPVAAACLTLADWRPWRLGRRARAAWSSKATTYLVSGVLFHLVLAALAFGAGRILHRLLG
jgi:hypothetical protein